MPASGRAWALATALTGAALTWWIYVPIHELLHVAGCLLTGGAVTELQVAPIYGGDMLAWVFPFVVAGGEYPGRLSGFDTKGSDLVYLATDFAPYLLTIFAGVPLLLCCTRGRRPLTFGAAVVLSLVPFSNLTGDYYEMGSVLVTRAATAVSGGNTLVYAGLRGDDVIRLAGHLRPDTDILAPGETLPTAVSLVTLSLAVGMGLCLATYYTGRWLARLVRS